MLNPQNLLPGNEQYETFTPATRKAGKRVQYDYRHTDGELFSCVKPSLGECRAARDLWIDKKDNEAMNQLISNLENNVNLEQIIEDLEKGPALEDIIAELEGQIKKRGGGEV